MLTYFEEAFRSFHTFNTGSIGQRGAKLLAVKVGGLKKCLPLQPSQPKCVQAVVRLLPGPNYSQVFR